MAAVDMRVLVLAPTAKDYQLLEAIFERHAIVGSACADLREVCAELTRGAGALLIAEEALTCGNPLIDWLQQQPPWSDLPILVLARPGIDIGSLVAVTARLGNITILERPTRVAALVSAVLSALRARQRQYQIRDHLAEQKKTAEQLRADDQRKDEFLAMLAHELRNPLAPISNGLQILNIAYRRDAETAPVRQMMERQIGSMKRLVDDLLEISRVTRGELQLHKQRAELAEIVKSAIESSQPLISAARHHLQVRLPKQPIYVSADTVRLAQALSNLLNNAAKYTKSGGTIELSAESAAGEVAICVADNGVGIPQELQPKIFDMFMQVDSSRDRAQGGLGIGLTLVKRLVELHGGSIEVFSAGVGRGSRFTMRLPLCETDNAKAERAAVGGGEQDLSRLHILIADDNRDAADTLAYLLRNFGASVQVTYGGADALAAVERGHPDAAVLDIGMHDIDGLQVAQRIRARNGDNDLLLIALTGWGQQQDVDDSKNAGFDYHLTKPVDIPQLLNLLTGAHATH